MKCAKPECSCHALIDDEYCFLHSERAEITDKRIQAQRRGGSKPKLPAGEVREFIRRRAEGYSFGEISKQINVSKPTLIKWSRKFREEIATEEKWVHERDEKRLRQIDKAIIEEHMKQIRSILDDR